MHLINTQTTWKVTATQKERINCVRMYLGVTWVSEICTTDGASFVSGILHDECQLNYKTPLTTPHQVTPGERSWFMWRRILKLLTIAPTEKNTTKNRLQQQLGEWRDTHSESGRWLSYQDANKKFYARETHEDKEWKIFEQTKGKTQLTCVDTIAEYQPTKYSTPVRIHTAAGGVTYKELGAELGTTAVDEKMYQADQQNHSNHY